MVDRIYRITDGDFTIVGRAGEWYKLSGIKLVALRNRYREELRDEIMDQSLLDTNRNGVRTNEHVPNLSIESIEPTDVGYRVSASNGETFVLTGKELNTLLMS